MQRWLTIKRQVKEGNQLLFYTLEVHFCPGQKWTSRVRELHPHPNSLGNICKFLLIVFGYNSIDAQHVVFFTQVPTLFKCFSGQKMPELRGQMKGLLVHVCDVCTADRFYGRNPTVADFNLKMTRLTE